MNDSTIRLSADTSALTEMASAKNDSPIAKRGK